MSEKATAVSKQENVNAHAKRAASLAFQDEKESKGKLNEDDTKPPAAKKARVIAAITPNNRSILLECTPEIMQNIYSFLNLKDALVLRQSCSTLNQGTDAFRYCQIIIGQLIHSFDGIATTSRLKDPWYQSTERRIICNLDNNTKLRALLSNESLSSCIAQSFLSMERLFPFFSRMGALMLALKTCMMLSRRITPKWL